MPRSLLARRQWRRIRRVPTVFLSSPVARGSVTTPCPATRAEASTISEQRAKTATRGRKSGECNVSLIIMLSDASIDLGMVGVCVPLNCHHGRTDGRMRRVVYENGRAYPQYLVRYYVGPRDPVRTPYATREEAQAVNVGGGGGGGGTNRLSKLSFRGSSSSASSSTRGSSRSRPTSGSGSGSGSGSSFDNPMREEEAEAEGDGGAEEELDDTD
jgi:hypothetical protein